MHNNKEIRWKQRFQNFKKAFLFLNQALTKPNLSELEKPELYNLMNLHLNLPGKL
jgi:hypothetical protein